jgi:hypothetical protein
MYFRVSIIFSFYLLVSVSLNCYLLE